MRVHVVGRTNSRLQQHHAAPLLFLEDGWCVLLSFPRSRLVRALCMVHDDAVDCCFASSQQ